MCRILGLTGSLSRSPGVIGHDNGKLYSVRIYVLFFGSGAFVSVSLWCYLACRVVGLTRIVVGVSWVLVWEVGVEGSKTAYSKHVWGPW